jgi:hypothetical protein
MREARSFALLGRLFPDQEGADLLLDEIGADLAKLPRLGGAPEEYWFAVCRKINLGVFTFPLERLVEAAVRRFPGSALKDLLEGARGDVSTRVLFLAANPTDLGRIRTDREQREIQDVLRTNRDWTLIPFLCTSPGDISRAFLESQPHIVHFSGHGALGGPLFEDRDGKSVRVEPHALSGLINALLGQGPRLRVLVLNACFTAGYSEALSGVADFVVGSSDAIPDATAVAFAREFYQALAAGRRVPDAKEVACKQLEVNQLPRPELIQLRP